MPLGVPEPLKKFARAPISYSGDVLQVNALRIFAQIEERSISANATPICLNFSDHFHSIENSQTQATASACNSPQILRNTYFYDWAVLPQKFGEVGGLRTQILVIWLATPLKFNQLAQIEFNVGF